MSALQEQAGFKTHFHCVPEKSKTGVGPTAQPLMCTHKALALTPRTLRETKPKETTNFPCVVAHLSVLSKTPCLRPAWATE